MVLMWTINDFLAYGMLSGWMTSGRLACPICMERTKAFSLSHSHNISYFDCHLIIHLEGIKRHLRKRLLRKILLPHVCLALIFGIGLHNFQFALNYKNKEIFLDMVLIIIRRKKVYFGGYLIGKLNFYAIILIYAYKNKRVHECV